MHALFDLFGSGCALIACLVASGHLISYSGPPKTYARLYAFVTAVLTLFAAIRGISDFLSK